MFPVRLSFCRTPPFAALVPTLVLGASCAITVPDAGERGQAVVMSRAELADYTEQVFRLHNRTLDRLLEVADAVESDDPGLHADIVEAEISMLDACADLNRYATAVRDRRRPDDRLRRAIPQTVGACEQATRRVMELLP